MGGKVIHPQDSTHPKPILLICDSHSYYLDVNTTGNLVDHNIHLYCLPPHTTNILQSLDIAVFGPMKVYFSKITDTVSLFSLDVKQSLNISKRNFTPIFKDTYECTLSIAVIKNGFRKCGVYPFDRNAIDKGRLMPNNESGGSVSTPQSPNFPNNTAENINSSTPVNSLPGGSYSAREALLRSGNIPTSLISSFIFPKTPEKRVKETCAITKARVLASEESQSQLKEKIAKNIGEVEAKKKRQKERERKRKEKERLAKEKEMRKKVKSKKLASSESSSTHLH